MTFMLGEADSSFFSCEYMLLYHTLYIYMSSAIFLLACISSMDRIIGAFHIVCLIAFLVDVNSVQILELLCFFLAPCFSFLT